eukprot:gene20645-22681_t
MSAKFIVGNDNMEAKENQEGREIEERSEGTNHFNEKEDELQKESSNIFSKDKMVDDDEEGEDNNEIEDKNDDKTEDDFDEETESSSSEESDSMDEVETEQKRLKYKDDIADLEKQFADLKEQLYMEKIEQVEKQLIEVQTNTASEYVIPMRELEESSMIRGEVAGHLKEFKFISLEHKFKAEIQAVEQHFKNEKYNLMENMKIEVAEKLRKVEEDRHTVEMYSDIWLDDSSYARKRKKGMEMFVPDKRKRPITVAGPYVVYMLREMDILEDWAAIRKAKSELARRKTEEENHPLIQARYEDGKFYYEGQCYPFLLRFQKGDKVELDNRVDSPVKATITTINTGEVWVSKRDGLKCKLYIAQFQKGKYLMRRQSNEVT